MHSRSSPLLSGPHPRTDLPDLLLVEPEEDVRRYGAALRAHFRVTHAESTDAALHALERTAPALVVADLALPGPLALSVCHAAKRLAPPPKILVTTTEVRQVPDAIIAGCDAVLLKPFAPNLLFARVGRLLRARAAEAGYPLVPQPATFRGGQDRGE